MTLALNNPVHSQDPNITKQICETATGTTRGSMDQNADAVRNRGDEEQVRANAGESNKYHSSATKLLFSIASFSYHPFLLLLCLVGIRSHKVRAEAESRGYGLYSSFTKVFGFPAFPPQFRHEQLHPQNTVAKTQSDPLLLAASLPASVRMSAHLQPRRRA